MDIAIIFKIVITGISATLIMDLWSLFQKYVIKIPPLNYRLVGRWILCMCKGKFRHNTILSTPPVDNEVLMGWVFHYLIGILFALIPLLLQGLTWFFEPSFITAISVGLLTIFAPFIILQPAFGFGLAASHMPQPWLARVLSMCTHLTYGLGLYVMVIFVKTLV